jgi:hypothetical protein
MAILWKSERKDHFEDIVVVGKIILKQILRKQGVMLWTINIWIGIGSGGGELLWTR